MKNLKFYAQIFIFLFLNHAFLSLTAQTPDAFSYQAVVRNASGDIISNQSVSFRISILQHSETGSIVYSETHQTYTNAFGLANLKVGKGIPVTGIFGPGGWGLAKHFIKVEIDVNGGNNYTAMGTTQLLAVPYAFHANTVENDQVDDADADSSNELQSLSLNGNQLTLSNGGGTVNLPSSGEGGDNWGTQTVATDASLDGDGTLGNPLKVNGDLTDDQTLSIDGNELSISNGNTINLPESTGSVWNTSGTVIHYSDGSVGIGTENPRSNLAVGGNGYPDRTIYAENSDPAGIAVYGYSTYSGSGGNYGGFFESLGNEGYGVVGNAQRVGILGQSRATSGESFGGYFQSVSSEGIGVYAKGGNYDFYGSTGSAKNYFAGKVGIGVEEPNAKLAIGGVGFASDAFHAEINTAYGSAIYCESKSRTGNTSAGIFYHNSTDGIALKVHATASSGSTIAGRFFNSSSEGTGVYARGGKYNFYAENPSASNYFAGKVGIGEHSPACELHIKQAGTNFQSGIRLERPDNINWWSIQINQHNDLVFDYNGTDTRAWIKNEDADFYHASDRRLKENINSLEPVLNKVMKLNPVTYRFKANQNNTDLSYGFIAQEVHEVFPLIVSENNGTLGISYQSFGVLGIKAIQEQQQIIETLKNEIEALKQDKLKAETDLQSFKNNTISRLEKLELLLNETANNEH